jgi:hypothetical protein
MSKLNRQCSMPFSVQVFDNELNTLKRILQ